jgi:hypothetical protein
MNDHQSRKLIPPVAQDPEASPRDRDLATWMETVEKVVFSAP